MNQTITNLGFKTTNLHPLCVDLDGTLVKSDTLVDSLLVLLRTHPKLVLWLPVQFLRGKAAFKAYISESISLDVAHLPYNRQVIQFLQQERGRGRQIYLATGADLSIARRVAAHLGFVTGILGSDGVTNLTGKRKLSSLRGLLGSASFDYIGNDIQDLSLLANAIEPMVANPSLGLRLRLWVRGIHPVLVFRERKHPLKSLLKAMRFHQWAKNLLIFVPLLLAHGLTIDRLLTALLAFCCFSLTASATYIVNDMLDIEADRRHPTKCLRPFALGDLSVFSGFGIVMAYLLLALLGARLLPLAFNAWLLFYLVSTLVYSLYLKSIVLVDVLVLAGLYILRLMAGGAATQTPISDWLAGFSMFLFLSLAIVKRFAELKNMAACGETPKNNRGYLFADLDQLRSFGTASAYAAVIVFAIYIGGPDVITLYRHPRLLWLIVPLMVLWLNWVWLLASRGKLDEDPVAFAITDRMSLLMGAAVAAIALLAL